MFQKEIVMKASELIEILKERIAESGDLEVWSRKASEGAYEPIIGVALVKPDSRARDWNLILIETEFFEAE